MRSESEKSGSRGWMWPLLVVGFTLSLEPMLSSCNQVEITKIGEAAQQKDYSVYPGVIDADTQKQLQPNMELGAKYIRDSVGAGRFHQYGQHGAVTGVQYVQGNMSGDRTVWLSGRLTFADQAGVEFQIFQSPKANDWEVTKFFTVPQSFKAKS